MISTQTDYQTVLDSLPFAAYIEDLNGKIVERNSKSYEYISGKLTDIKENNSGVIPAINFKKPVVFEKKLQMQNKQEIWHRVTKSPIFNKNQETTGVLVLLENIESEKEIEQKKETFVAALTHDLKTPTVAQIRMLEILLKEVCGKLNKEQKEVLEQTLKSAKYMLGMISRVLYVYKFESGNIKLEYKEFNFKELLYECSNELIPLCRDKNTKLNIKINTKNASLSADKVQIRRVLINLISNSIFYAAKNTQIDIELKEEDKDFIFTVTNSSPYIPPEILNTLFDKYVSNSSNLTAAKEGTGLGLYITERIISAHKGKIIAKSSRENLNTFGFKISKNLI